MKRITIITPDIVGPVKNGGIGTACYHYARTLANAGLPVDLLFASHELESADLQKWRAWYADMSIAFYAMNDVAPASTTSIGSRWYHERSRRIMEWCRQRSPSYLIFQDWQANGFWSVRAKQQGYAFDEIPIAVVAHSPTDWQNEGMKSFGSQVIYDADLSWCERETIAGADILISPSRHMVEWLTTHSFGLPPRVEICSYTFEDEPGQPPSQPIDRSHLIFFGRLETRKGLHLFGGALRALAAQGDILPRKVSLLGKLATVDGEPTGTYLRQLRDDLPDVEIVVFTDFDYVDAIQYIWNASAVVVMPSVLDNLPLTVIESINNRLPFIASTTGGIPEMVDPHFLFSPTSKDLAAKLISLSTLDFHAANHLYSAERARSAWLAHVRDVTHNQTSPNVHRHAEADHPPPISVCIPFYRHDRYVPRLIRAFLRMHLPNLQLVIVDDGTPETERLQLDAIRDRLERMGHTVHSQLNAGPGAARNKAISLSKHDHLLFFDADNIPFQSMVRDLWRAMSRTNADSIAAPFAAVPPMTSIPTKSDVLYHFHPPGGSPTLALFDNTLGDMTALIRREALDAVKGFHTRIAEPGWEDWELFFRLAGTDHRHFVYPSPLLFYTDHPNRSKSPAQLYNLRASLLMQLEHIDRGPLVSIAKSLAAHTLSLRDAGAW